MTELIDDRSLVQRAQLTDMAALRCLFLRHHNELLGRIRAKFPASLQSVADPEDVLQVTYADAAAAIISFEFTTPHSFLNWMTKIGQRNLADLVRFHKAVKRGGRMRRRGQSLPAGSAADSDEWYSFVFQHSLTPSRAVAKREALVALQLALAELKPEYREVIELRFLAQISDQEIAQRMNRPAGTIHGLCFRAMRRLRQRMGRYSRYFSHT